MVHRRLRRLCDLPPLRLCRRLRPSDGHGAAALLAAADQHPAYDEYWQDQAVDRILAAKPLTVPTLLIGSEWDQEDIYGAPAVFNAVKASPNAHLALGPWYHGEVNSVGMALGAIDWGIDTGDGSARTS